MGLTNTQYDSIIRKYGETQMNNRRILDERKEYVYSHVEGFKELEDSVITVSLDYAKKKLSGDESSIEELHALLEDLKEMKAHLLKGVGLPEDYLDPIYTCKDCKDTGYIGNTKCHCFVRQIIELLYDSSNMRSFIEENNFSKLSYDFYKGEGLTLFKNAVDRCKRLIDDFENEKGNILLYGTVGTGKSFLSGCVAGELIEKGYSCVYYSSISLFETIAKETFHSSSATKDELYNLYDCLYNCDLLIIDDLGTETVNSFVASSLFALINERHLRKKSTIISTNLSLEQIRDIYSDRVFSRIANSYSLLKLVADDIRIQKKQLNIRK